MKPTQKSNPEEAISRYSSARKLLILALIAGVVVLTVYFLFFQEDQTSRVVTVSANTSVEEPSFVKEGALAFLNATQQDTLRHISVEVADNDAERAQGLMYRTKMEDSQGMLFIFPQEAPRSFWMKNTKIPLDIIYVDGNKQIVTLHQGVMPYSEKSLPSSKPAQYVIEVNAGFTGRYGIQEGDRVMFEIDGER